MFEFSEEVIVTGISNRVSKQGKEYKVLNILDENGQTFGCMVDCVLPRINQLDRLNLRFKVVPGRYTQMKVIGVCDA